MSKLFSGQLFLIDHDEDRVTSFKNNLNSLNHSIFFNHFNSVHEAFKMVLTPGIIAPEFIYIHVCLATFEAKDILNKIRKIQKTTYTKIIVFGNVIPDGMVAASIKYNFRIVKTHPEIEKSECCLFYSDFISLNRKLICSPLCKCC
ncbi:hypothetical protein [Flavobacterium psychrotrophum]|uniref:hypothetical protein n=1 Tax=Flavobacterium psychrotrophum TaxID=2294119 RepID=UPI000E323C79|nr:hypothetical protein [Flavobacterium psychrotrophum]